MTLEKKLLQKVPDWHPTPHERAALTVAADEGPWSARLTVDRCEELSAALWELRLERASSPLALTHDQLENWAKGVVQSASFIDPLAIIEIDRTRGRAAATQRLARRARWPAKLFRDSVVEVRPS